MYLHNTTPYTYLIGWSKLNIWYYGVRYADGCHPGDLWVTYFTSSKYVADFVSEHGEPDVREIRQQFTDITKARLWETCVLKRMNVVLRENFLNKSDNISIAPMPGEENPMYGIKRPEGLMRKAGKAGLAAQKILLETDPEWAIKYKKRQEAFAEAGRRALSKREDGSSVSRDMVIKGTHNFLGGNIQSKSNQKRLKNKTHHLLGGAQQRKQLEDGLHPTQIKITCLCCHYVCAGTANFNQHIDSKKCASRSKKLNQYE